MKMVRKFDDDQAMKIRGKSRRVTSSVPGERCSKVRRGVSYSVEVERPRADLSISREWGCHTSEEAESGVEGRSCE